MTNHPNRSTRFEIAVTDPWFIRVDTGNIYWPALVFPFQMTGAGTEEGTRIVKAAARAALRAAETFYRHDDTGSFSPSLALLNRDNAVVHHIPVVEKV